MFSRNPHYVHISEKLVGWSLARETVADANRQITASSSRAIERWELQQARWEMLKAKIDNFQARLNELKSSESQYDVPTEPIKGE